MYGLVNKAIEDMVCNQFGLETWQQIKHQAGVEVETFISMEGYPDDLTHRLVKAASEVLDLSAAEIMEAFGQYWVQYTAEEGYSEMMDMGGDNLPEFLNNLDDLHARVGVIFPKLSPPSFECTDGCTEKQVEQDTESLTLHYHSHRQGLAAMVIGLVQGLGKRFNTVVDVTQTHSRSLGADHDEFSVKYQTKP